MFKSTLRVLVFPVALTGWFLSPMVGAQSLGDLMRTFKQATSSDALSVIKSFTETLQGQVTPGTQAENAEGKVVLFRTSWCGYCKQAAAYMQKKNIPFVERDIEASAASKAEYTKLGGIRGVPFIVFGQKTIYGFSESVFDKNYAEFLAGPAAGPLMANGKGAGLAQTDTETINAGQAMVGKLPGVKVYAQPTRSAKKMLILSKADEVVYMGEERDGFYRITTQKGDGWADKLMLKKP